VFCGGFIGLRSAKTHLRSGFDKPLYTGYKKARCIGGRSSKNGSDNPSPEA
jgi:hypothetical protein